MLRVLEPELMDDFDQAAMYARADFSASNQLFVDLLLREFPGGLRTAIDIGCGPGDVAIRLADASPAVTVTAIDGSGAMIALARDFVRAAGLDRRIRVRQERIPTVALQQHAFDAVLSKDMLHHLADPLVLWREAARLGRRGGVVHVMDLVRPETPDEAHAIVEAVSGGEPAPLKCDFFNSLCAAFTFDEVRAQLTATGLPLTVTPAGDRHMLVSGRLT